MNKTKLSIAAIVLACVAAAPALAQDKVLKLIVPSVPGNPADMIARVLAKRMGEAWQVPVVVENKPGAAGNIGTTALVSAPGDGLTLMVTNSGPLVLNKALLGTLPYDPVADITPITKLAWAPNVIVVPVSSPARTLQEFVALAKSRPGKLNTATAGVGGMTHIGAAMLNSQAGITTVLIPYSGGPQASTAIMSGEADIYFENNVTAKNNAAAGKMKALAVTSAERFRLVPEIPSMTEAGFKNFDNRTWFGLVAPGTMDKALAADLSRKVNAFLKEPRVRAELERLGYEAAGNTPQEFAEENLRESGQWAKVIKEANIKP
jgi:tripartite-type tricarboxylate transporter receptor subunit TctC